MDNKPVYSQHMQGFIDYGMSRTLGSEAPTKEYLLGIADYRNDFLSTASVVDRIELVRF